MFFGNFALWPILASHLWHVHEQDIKIDKRCVIKRRVIKRALSLPKNPLSKENAYSKSVILPEDIQKKAERRNKETCKVIKTVEIELHCPSFQQQIPVVLSILNKDEKTRDLNAKTQHKKMVGIRSAKAPRIID